jgi:ABC-type branched-subunit amino acid transport system ATPase component
MTSLELHGVTVDYDGVRALGPVDLAITGGELVCLIGHNGAGKSTLLRVAAGLQRASGRVVLDGRDVTTLAPERRARAGVRLVNGGDTVFASLNTGVALICAARAAGYDRHVARGKVAAVGAMFPELAERMGTPGGALSAGEQQMLGIAQALVGDPQVLLIDELALGLAPAVTERLTGVLEDINARGTTIVFSDQSADTALSVARRACVLDAGRIAYDGPGVAVRGRDDLLRPVFLGTAR